VQTFDLKRFALFYELKTGRLKRFRRPYFLLKYLSEKHFFFQYIANGA
jgi:hypothetical protein